MTKQNNEKPSSSNSRAGGIIGLVMIVVAIIITQLTGVDVLGMLAPVEPTAIPVSDQPAGVVEPVDAAATIFSVFSEPTGSRDPAVNVNGTDTVLAESILTAESTIDVAAFELNSQAIADALLAQHANGVTIRLVTDDDHGMDVSLYEEYLAADEDEKEDLLDEFEEDPEDTLLDELYNAGIPIVDDDRSALMHNKFVIIDGVTLWTGSMNMTVNGSYRNNNNLNRIQSSRIAANYQAEFNEMFEDQEFGPRSPANTPNPEVTVNGVPIEVYFAPEDDVVPQIIEELNAAEENIRFMAFSFTLDEVGEVMLAKAADGVALQGVFETTGSQTQYSEMTSLYCAGLDVRQDGNSGVMHHKVIIVDDDTTLVGSFNFSASATESNDENLMIIHDPAITAQYIAEFESIYAEGHPPEDGVLSCD